MRIGTYNILGGRGYPSSEGCKELGDPSSERTVKHFANVFESLDCDILGLQEGLSLMQIQRVATTMAKQVATIPSPIVWNGHVITRFPIMESQGRPPLGANLSVFPACRDVSSGQYPSSLPKSPLQ